MKRLLLFFTSLIFASFVAVGTTGCGTTNLFGVQSCSGPNCTRADAYATIGEMRSQATILTNANKINSTQATNVRTQLRIAEDAVDASNTVGGGDQLDKARGILAALRTTLLSYGATLK